MKNWFLPVLLVSVLAGCSGNSEETAGNRVDPEDLPTEEERERWENMLLPLEDQLTLMQELTEFYGSEEAFLEHGFAYVDEKQNSKGFVGIKDPDSPKTEELKKRIYEEFTEEQVEFVKADYTAAELMDIQNEISQYLEDIGVTGEMRENPSGDLHMAMHPNYEEQKIVLEVSPITDEQLQMLEEKYGEVLEIEVTFGRAAEVESGNDE